MKEVRPCFLFHVDTVVIYWNGLKRYILTTVDHATRLGYTRMYRNKRSRSAAEFLYRLRYLVNQTVENLQTDNGSEFALEFERATAKLGIHRYFSRVKTPKDNPEIERFNETLEYELPYNFNLSLGPQELNPRLNQWLIEYNFNRPHKSLAYLTPVEYIEHEFAKIFHQVLHMYLSLRILQMKAPCFDASTRQAHILHGKKITDKLQHGPRGPLSVKII
ncbi:MAG TPA: integrase core domain-containing protein [Dehalococcoidia bacterium]|nr:integrase core domain-containing protein [Dehalococcoidia bacterium]